jgi:hypothetical protein
VKQDTVCVFGGLGPNSILQTIPLFVDITTGKVTSLHVKAPFSGLQQHTGALADDRLYYTGGYKDGRKSYETWILDLEYSVWLRLDLVPFHRTAWFLLPIHDGFRLFNDTLLQSVALRYTSPSAFIETLIENNISSNVYDFDESKSESELARVHSQEEELLGEISTTCGAVPGFAKLIHLTSQIHETRRVVLSLESSIASAFPGDGAPRPREPSPVDFPDDAAPEGLIAQLAKRADPQPPNADLLKPLAQAVQAAVACEAAPKFPRGRLRPQCDANAHRIARQLEEIKQLRERIGKPVECCDLRSLLDGADLSDELTADVAAVANLLYATQVQYAQTRVTICQRRLAVFDLANGRIVDGARAACERFAAIEKADAGCKSLRAFIAGKAERCREIEAQCERLLARGAAGSPTECEFYARAVADAIARLSEWVNEAAAAVGAKQYNNALGVPRPPERTESVRAPHPMKHKVSLTVLPGVPQGSADLPVAGGWAVLTDNGPAQQATAPEKWHASTIAAIRRVTEERRKAERRPK